VAVVPAFLICGYVYWRVPLRRVARRLLGLGAASIIWIALGEILSVAWLMTGSRPWYWLLVLASQITQLSVVAAGVALLAVFPDGVYQRPYERAIVRVVTAQVLIVPALLLLSSATMYYDPGVVWAKPLISSPLHVPALAWLQNPLADYYYSIFLWAPLGAIILALRFRRLAPELQLQVKWPLLGTIGFGATVVVGAFSQLGLVPHWFSQAAWFLAVPLFALSIAIAMLGDRLLDIDVVIRKSLVYGVLWTAILTVYLGLVWRLGLAAGDRLPVELAILLTIAATLAFQPARRSLEGLADRFVFGQRLTGYQAMQRLGSLLETTAEPVEVASRMAATIRSALALSWVRVSSSTVRGDKRETEVLASDGIAASTVATAETLVPLENAGDVVGIIECGPKIEGTVDQTDRDLLSALARQAALALKNTRLASDLSDQLDVVKRQAQELAESRARIVHAQDAERTRIQRDLHDGIQVHLVAVAAKLRGATRMRGPRLREEVRSLAADAEETVFALQDFSNGIYPSVLSDAGLPAALWSHAQRLPIKVELDIPQDMSRFRFGRERENALYFVALEAIVNAQKHARATAIRVSLQREVGSIRLEVADDGIGLQADGNLGGRGLSNMRDRVAALGGSLEILGVARHGTRVVAEIPEAGVLTSLEATPEGRSAQPTRVG
jgi:signal transduction histidine kinase